MADVTHHDGTIYRQQPSSSGQLEYVSTGCTRYDENVATAGTTAAATFKNHGLSVVSTTHPNTLARPVKGCVKQILFRGTTKAMKVKSSSSGILINSTHDDTLAVTLGTTKLKNIGIMATLYGASTALYWLDISGSTDVTITLTTST